MAPPRLGRCARRLCPATASAFTGSMTGFPCCWPTRPSPPTRSKASRRPDRMDKLAPPPREVITADVARALAEDLGTGDVTAALLPDGPENAYLLCKEDAVVCGRPW